MRKFLKIVSILLGSLLLLISILALYVKTSSLPTYEVNAPELKISIDSAKVAEGYRIATALCSQCHASEDGKLGGAFMEKSAIGNIHAPNITQHPEHGIAKYTDGELALLLRTGIKRDGNYAPPWMSKLPHLSDEDLESVIAFLKSDHPMVQASDKERGPITYGLLGKALIKFGMFKPLPYPEEPVMAPKPTDKVAYGKYLATAKYECYGCHSESFMKVDIMVPENTPGYFGGGNQLKNKKEEIMLSKNLTMDPETGLGNWTEEEFIRAVKYGALPNGEGNRSPMLAYSQLSDQEVAAIWAYFKTLPIIKNEKVQSSKASQAALTDR